MSVVLSSNIREYINTLGIINGGCIVYFTLVTYDSLEETYFQSFLSLDSLPKISASEIKIKLTEILQWERKLFVFTAFIKKNAMTS